MLHIVSIRMDSLEWPRQWKMDMRFEDPLQGMFAENYSKWIGKV